MESQLEKDAVNEVELKRSFFRLTMKSTHLYRQFHMINDHYELELGSKLIDIRRILERKSQLTLWFYRCSGNGISNNEILELIKVEKEIYDWTNELITIIDEK